MLPSLDLHSLTTDPTKVLLWDLETDGLLDSVSKLHVGVTETLAGHRTIFRANNGREIIEHLDSYQAIVGHNIVSYDLPALQKIYGSRPTKPVVIDTLVLSRLAFPMLKVWDWSRKPKDLPPKKYGSHSLGAWGIRLGIHKDTFGESEGAFERWTQELEDYCIRDVAVTKTLLNFLLGRQLPAVAVGIETELQDIIAHQERHGFSFDTRKCQGLVAELQGERDQLLVKLQEQFPTRPSKVLGVFKNQEAKARRMLSEVDPNLTLEHVMEQEALGKGVMVVYLEAKGVRFKRTKPEPFNPASDKQVAERLQELGWVPTEFTDKGQPCVDEDTLNSLVSKFPSVAPLARFNMLDKRLGQMAHGNNAWLKLVGPDGRMHGRANTMGTVTFRFTHSNPNMGQVPSCRLPYGRECRSLFHVPVGSRLVGCDVSGLELRILSHYLEPLDGGEFLAQVTDGDIHTRNMEAAGLSSRDRAKTFIYALLYGAGDAKLGEIVAPDLTSRDKLSKAGAALRRRFLSKTPALATLTKSIQHKVSRFKTLKAIDGRTLEVRSAHSALNTLIQSSGSIVVKAATVLFRRLLEAEGLCMGREWSLVVHVHDEWQTEVKEQHAQRVADIAIRSIVLAGQLLGVRCPLTGEAKIGLNWADTH